jgi:hypothetical protein
MPTPSSGSSSTVSGGPTFCSSPRPPVQNDLDELFNLVTLLQPGQLSTLRAFRRDHVTRGDRRQPRDPEGLRRLLTDVMVRNGRATTAVALTHRVARTVTVASTPAEQALYTSCRRSSASIAGREARSPG